MTARIIKGGALEPYSIRDSNYEFEGQSGAPEDHRHTYLTNRMLLTPLNGFANLGSFTPLSIYTLGNIGILEGVMTRAALITSAAAIKIADIPTDLIPKFLPVALRVFGKSNVVNVQPQGMSIDPAGDLMYHPNMFFGNYTADTVIIQSGFFTIK